MNEQTLRVALGERSYPIHIGQGLLDRAAEHIALDRRPRLLISDDKVAPLYAARAAAALEVPESHVLVVPAGEASKSMTRLSALLDDMLALRLPRDGVVLALGGGVIGDLAGFAAAIYQRGIDFVQLPTTLLAMVDSSVGGKTGINHARGKNLIGAFHQPLAVLADTDTLSTLPPREFDAGLAEVYKYGLLGDAAFLDWLDAELPAIRALDARALGEMIARCCRMKAEIVAADERESGARALLNLGHTFGHAIEAHEAYAGYLHGEAIAVGMRLAIRASAALGRMPAAEAERAEAMLDRAGLPAAVPAGMTAEDFRRHMALDKKVRGGRLRLILLDGLGKACVTSDYDDAVIHAVLSDYCREHAV